MALSTNPTAAIWMIENCDKAIMTCRSAWCINRESGIVEIIQPWLPVESKMDSGRLRFSRPAPMNQLPLLLLSGPFVKPMPLEVTWFVGCVISKSCPVLGACRTEYETLVCLMVDFGTHRWCMPSSLGHPTPSVSVPETARFRGEQWSTQSAEKWSEKKVSERWVTTLEQWQKKYHKLV